ncbi:MULTISPECIES: YveK family protein [unclassified Listeria]|uniref:YveK family protein n=1 Tax=unclassified Listeria TaxID=2642072 RepID=UPI000B58CD08|nr:MULTISPECIES: Wzz/FepE/Etk N-terminal domain-containing protein [unclassified Listeria]
MENTLDVSQLWNILKENKWIIIFSTCASLLVMVIYLYFFSVPIYKSESEVLINQANSEKSTSQAEDVQANLKLVNTYTSIMESPRILSQVSSLMDNKYSVDELSQMITVTSPTDSQVIQVSVEGSNPKDIVKIANETVNIFSKTIPKIMNVNNVYTLSPAVYSPKMAPIKPHKSIMLALSVAFGLILGIIIMFIRNLFDNTIKTAQDVERNLGLVVLTSINKIEPENLATTRKNASGLRSTNLQKKSLGHK